MMLAVAERDGLGRSERWQHARQRAKNISGDAYAIDDQTAISVVDGVASVVSEGHWERLNPRHNEAG